MVRNSQDLKNETTLWELFRNGEESAFSALFELTSDKLYRYGTKFVSDEESVKDCIQELFIKLYENRQQLPALSNPLFYLFSSLKNLLIDMIRHNQRMVYISPEELPFHVQFAFGQEEDEEPDESIKARFEEMSYDEISQLLGINNQSARNIVHRAMEKIRSCLNMDTLIILFLSSLN